MNDDAKMPYPTEEDGAMYWVLTDKAGYEQHSNNVQTEFEQGSSNVQTEFEQGLSNVQSDSPQRSNETTVLLKQLWNLQKARGSKQPPMQEDAYLEENEDIVNALMDNDFVSAITNYTSYKEIPMSMSSNDRLTNGFLLKGIKTSPNTVAKVAACMRFRDLKKSTISKFKAKALCVFVAIVSIYLTSVCYHAIDRYSTPDETDGNVMMASVGGTGNVPPDIGSIISDFERRKTFKFYLFRREVISKQIKESGDYSAANCEIILQQNMAAQIQATKKK